MGNGATQIALRKRSVLLIWAPAPADSDPKIEAIRAAYKSRFGQESVLRVDGLSARRF